MQGEEELAGWLTLSRAPSLDLPTLEAAFASLPAGTESPAATLVQSADAFQREAGLAAATREYLHTARRYPRTARAGARASTRGAGERAWLDSPHHALVPFTDPRYPPQLRRLKHPPLVLYVAGHAHVLQDAQLAIVGSRNPSAAGRDSARAFAESLAGCGLTITSGLASGIDSAAHEGALRVQGMTIAVLGSGVDVIYPQTSRALAEDIQLHGALISEFPLGTPPRRENFPQRNRIIAAMSLGTLVIEAALRSGSLITARLAADHGREVFAVPGSIHNPLSRGCHQLIRDGAKLTEVTADILRELDFSAFFTSRDARTSKPERSGQIAAAMDKHHKILLDALGFDPADLDSLVARSGFKAETVSSMMLILELEGHVQAAPGGRFLRVVRSRR